jgi:hypothetical protein
VELLPGAQDSRQRHRAGRRPPQCPVRGQSGHEKKWTADLADAQKKAEALEAKVEQAEARAGRFDLAEALLEIGLVITSVTLLTRSRWYWYLGLLFSLAGVLSVASAFLIH